MDVFGWESIQCCVCCIHVCFYEYGRAGYKKQTNSRLVITMYSLSCRRVLAFTYLVMPVDFMITLSCNPAISFHDESSLIYSTAHKIDLLYFSLYFSFTLIIFCHIEQSKSPKHKQNDLPIASLLHIIKF